MSIFRIHHKKVESSSRHKIHSQQSRNLTQTFKSINNRIFQTDNYEQQNSSIQLRKRRITTHIHTLQQGEIERPRKNFDAYKMYNIKLKCNQFFRNRSISSKFKQTGFISKQHINFENEKQKRKQINSTPKISKVSAIKIDQKLKLVAQTSNKSLQKRKAQLKSHLKTIIPNKNSKKQSIISNRQHSYEQKQKRNNLLQQGLKYYKQKNTIKALKSFIKLLQYQPNHIECLYYVGSCYFNQGQNQRSLDYLRQLQLLNYQYNTNMYLYMAINYKMLSNDLSARQTLQQAIKIFPKFQQAYFYLGKIYIKLQDYIKAQQMFLTCIHLNHTNYLPKIFLADCYKFLQKQQQAIKIYKQLMENEKNYKNLDQKSKKMTHLKLVELLIKKQNYDDSLLKSSIKKLLKSDQISIQVQYYQCVIKYFSFQSISSKISFLKTTLQTILSQSMNYQLNIKCIKLLMRILIDSKDMYGAQQLLNRCQRLHIQSEDLGKWKIFVQATNDIIKRKYQQSKEKLQQALDCIQIQRLKINNHSNIEEIQYLQFHSLSYLAYIQFTLQNFQKANEMYNSLCNEAKFPLIYKFKVQNQREIPYNQIVAQAVLAKQAPSCDSYKAKQCLQKSLQIVFRSQCAFMWCINQIDIMSYLTKDCQFHEREITEAHHLHQICLKLKQSQKISPKHSLIYFYHSLIELYKKSYQSALHLIKLGILTSQQAVSQFHYIQALCYYLLSKQNDDKNIAYHALQSMNKAIQIDSSIPEFYKERSKHHYCLGNMSKAVQDCNKSMQDNNNDQQAQILIMFYYYLQNQYQKSSQILHKLIYKQKGNDQTKNSTDKIQHKYKQFEQSLNFRLKKYDKIGVLSEFIKNITTKDKASLNQQYLQFLHQLLDSKQQYSQFTVYFISLLLAFYYCRHKQYKKSLNYLFLCLQQIQVIIQEKNTYLNCALKNVKQNNSNVKQSNQNVKQNNQNAKQNNSNVKQNNQNAKQKINSNVKQNNFNFNAQQINYNFNAQQSNSNIRSSNSNVEFNNDNLNVKFNNSNVKLNSLNVKSKDPNIELNNSKASQQYLNSRIRQTQQDQKFVDKTLFQDIDTDMMLNQIKFNIVIVTLMKNTNEIHQKNHHQQSLNHETHHHQNSLNNHTNHHQNSLHHYTNLHQGSLHHLQQTQNYSINYRQVYEQTINFLNAFIQQTQSQELFQNLQLLKKLIKSAYKKSSQQDKKYITIKPYEKITKFSDQFQDMQVQIGGKYILTTKLITFYSTKLKFNIQPQFDNSFLYNFDMDKIQSKLIPPWFKFSQQKQINNQNQNNHKINGQLLFTDQIRNQSIALTQTERQPSAFDNKHQLDRSILRQSIEKGQNSIGNQSYNNIQNLKLFMRLDSAVQKKLNKMFKQPTNNQ